MAWDWASQPGSVIAEARVPSLVLRRTRERAPAELAGGEVRGGGGGGGHPWVAPAGLQRKTGPNRRAAFVK